MLLTTSIFIFIYFQNLHCVRNFVHIHAFLSFAGHALIRIIQDHYFLKSLKVGSSEIEMKTCRVLYAFRNYFYITNQAWVFIEATYLHRKSDLCLVQGIL